MAKARGETRMRELQYRKVVVWLDPKEFAAILAKVRRQRRPLATWIRLVACKAAGYEATAR